MQTFLDNIAEAYCKYWPVERPIVHFLFPNSRSADYFDRAMGEKLKRRGEVRRYNCRAFGRAIEYRSGMRRASSNRILLLVYKAYCTVLRHHSPNREPDDFDRFRYWGEMLLRDFDDVDRYMVNSRDLFRNVDDYRNIQSFYLTDDQLEIIRRFWGDDPYWGRLYAGVESAEETPFWGHIGRMGEPVKRFKQLWELLMEIYDEFRALLSATNECYTGMAYRKVAEMIKADASYMGDDLYVFIGFNRLSTAETMILNKIKLRGQGHFYWDYDPSLMDPKSGNKAGRFIADYAEHFSEQLAEYEEPKRPAEHTVAVIGVPSGVAQAKVVATLLDREDTAIILPDNDLLLQVVSSIPQEIANINVTMGYPLRHSSMAQIYDMLVSLQQRKTRSGNGKTEYFRGDVMRLISSPAIYASAEDECRAVRELLMDGHHFNLPARAVANGEDFPTLSVLLRPLRNVNNPTEAISYIRDVMAVVERLKITNSLERKAIETLTSQLDELALLIDEMKLEMRQTTFFALVARVLFSRDLPMKGKDFDVLQVMDFKETRALCFAHPIMADMTDEAFPGRHFSRSFIPEALRRAYGLPTAEHTESDSAYYFYRLLSWAGKLDIIYDSRQGGLASGEMSRFARQLLHLRLPGVTATRMEVDLTSEDGFAERRVAIELDTVVAKTPEVMKRLGLYLDPDQVDYFHLSASALKSYLACPMAFYLQRVADIYPADPVKQTLDAGILGNTIHQCAENLYKLLPEKHVTADVIKQILDGGYDNLLLREERRAINVNVNRIREYLTDPESEKRLSVNPEVYSTPLYGEGELYYDVIDKAMRRLLNAELTPFDIEGTEETHTFHWKLAHAPGFNFTMKIDRVDRIDGHLRVVDYKTGIDKIDIGDSLAKLFVRDKHNDFGGVMQVLAYCAALESDEPERCHGPIQPIIYRTKEDGSELARPISIGSSKANSKHSLMDYAEVKEPYERLLADVISEIFDPEVPFHRSPDPDACTFCNFKRYCYVTPPSHARYKK